MTVGELAQGPVSKATILGDNRTMNNQTTMTQAVLTERQRKYEVRRIAFAERYTAVKGFVDNRPLMPSWLCRKMVQDLVKDGVPKDARIGVVDPTPVLILYLHEAGFTNLTHLNTKQVKTLRKKDRDWLSMIERLCETNGIRVCSLMSKTPHFDVIIGNPPYGNAACLAIRFLNHAFDICNDVRLVMPRSITGKTNILNRVRHDIVCESDEHLPHDTFPSNIQANYQRWAPGTRAKTKKTLNHDDWTWLNSSSDEVPDFVIRHAGTRSGALFFSDHPKFEHYCKASYYHNVKADPEIIARFKEMEQDLIKAADSCNGRPHAGKAFIVDFYNQRFN